MNLSTLAQIVFFGTWAINYWWPFKLAGVILAVAAAVIAILLLLPTIKKLFQ